MNYKELKIKTEDYFDDTVKMIDRMYGNDISAYDREHQFLRVSNGNDYHHYESTGDYDPKSYTLPPDCRFTSHETAVLAVFASMNLNIVDPDIIWKETANMTEEDKQDVKDGNRAQKLLSVAMKTDSFFTAEPRYISKTYVKEMERGREYVHQALNNHDVGAIANVCKEGFKDIKEFFDVTDTKKPINYYATCFLCGELLDIMDRNPDIAKEVALSKEDRTYLEGIRTFGKILKEGEIARDRLKATEQLSVEEIKKYKAADQKYWDLASMLEVQKEEFRKKMKVDELSPLYMMKAANEDVQKRFEPNQGNLMEFLPNIALYGFSQENSFIRELGEAREHGMDGFFEKVHSLAEEGRSKGVVPGIEMADVKGTLKKLDSERDKLFDESTTKEKYLTDYEKEAKERAASCRKERIGKWEVLFNECNTQLEDRNLDNFLRGSSDEFRAIKSDLRKIQEYLSGVGAGKPYSETSMKEMMDKLKRDATCYLVKKDGPNNEHVKHEGDTYADRRYNFVLGLLEPCRNFEKELNANRSEVFTEISKRMMHDKAFAEFHNVNRPIMNKIVQFTLIKSGQMDATMDAYYKKQVNLDKLTDTFKNDALNFAKFADKTMDSYRKSDPNMDVSAEMIQTFDKAIEQVKQNGGKQQTARTKTAQQQKTNASERTL